MRGKCPLGLTLGSVKQNESTLGDPPRVQVNAILSTILQINDLQVSIENEITARKIGY